jgi:myo-inositol-1(or 4)-monophosphatase
LPETEPEPARDVGELERMAVSAARAGAELIAGNVGRAVAVGLKSSPTDVVTQTDIDAEHLIRDVLAAATPDAGFIGEEGGRTASAGPSSAPSSLQWIIDPLDGTVNFTYGLPVMAVSVAAAVDGSVVAAAVVDILRCEVFSASLDRRARLDGVVMTGSVCGQLSEAMVTTGFSYRAELRGRQGEVVAQLLPRVRDIRCFGSAALQMCWVAVGRVDGYYERDTKLWDYAASALIASEAGMSVELPCPENDGLAIAAPPALFADLRSAVEVARPGW